MLLLRNLLFAVLLSAAAAAGDKPAIPALRWTQGATGCTFQEDQAGRYHYGLSYGDYDITLALDGHELEKIPHRATPMLGVFISFHYHGSQQLEVQQNRFTLEFVKHFQLVQSSLDPDDLLKQLQQNVEDLTDEVERHQIKKHPELKQQKEAELQARLKDYAEMMDFISTRTLRPAVLDASNSSAGGWVFFGIRNKRIGPWHKPEQFILRLPVENLIVEFPFTLPPEDGKVELRQRADAQ